MLHTFEHPQPGAQNWNNHGQGAGNLDALCGLLWRLDGASGERQCAARFVAEQDTKLFDELTEERTVRSLLTQNRKLVLNEWMINRDNAHTATLVQPLIQQRTKGTR